MKEEEAQKYTYLELHAAKLLSLNRPLLFTLKDLDEILISYCQICDKQKLLDSIIGKVINKEKNEKGNYVLVSVEPIED